MDFWKAQLLRGIAELTLLGSPIYTCRDHSVDRTASIFGLLELKSRVVNERKFYRRLQKTPPSLAINSLLCKQIILFVFKIVVLRYNKCIKSLNYTN